MLVIDGELPQADLRQRVKEVRSAAERRARRGQFTIISADRVDGGERDPRKLAQTQMERRG